MPRPRAGFQVAPIGLAALALGAGLVLAAGCGDGEEGGGRTPAGAGEPAALRPEDAARLVALENRGIGLLERFDYGAAAEVLREAHALAPQWIPGRVNLALALVHVGPETRDEARRIFDGVLADDPEQPHAAFLAAWLAENAGETERSVELYRTAWRVTGEDPVVGAKLGIALASLEGREREALEILIRVHERQPALVAAVNQIMLLKRALGDEEGAAPYLKLLEALNGKLRPDLGASKVGTVTRDAYGNMGPYSAAVRDFGDPGLPKASAAAGAVTAAVADVPGWTAGALPDGAPYLGAAALDFDSDGDVDLFVCGGKGPSALFRNDGGKLTDVAKEAGAAVEGAYAAAAGELDVDPSVWGAGEPGRRARVDLVVLREGGVTVLRNKGDGTFEDATGKSGLSADPGGARAVLTVDADQDGDLDLFLSGQTGQTNRLWANKGPGVFEDATKDSGLAGDGGAYGPAVVLDFDEDYDLDLVVSRPAAPPAIYANDRLLRFHAVEAPREAGGAPHGIVAGDFDRDGHEDFALCHDTGSQWFAGTGRGFEPGGMSGSATPRTVTSFRAAGTQDLVGSDGSWWPAEGTLDWIVQASGVPPLWTSAGLANVLAADLDGDGAEEIVRIAPDAPVQVVTLHCANRGNAVVLDLEGVIRNDVQAGWSNLEGRGALVEVKAGALWQQRRAGNPSGFGCGAPARLVCGIAGASQADFVRILWPDAVQQGVLDVPSGSPQPIVEEQRRPDSCPLIFSWDGERWVFVTDFLGVGGVGFLVAPGVYGPPDPTESVKIEASQLEPRDDGRVVLKLLEPMEEVCYLDACDLLVVDHPADVAVFPDERFAGEPPFPDGRLLAHRGEILPVAARDGRGQDVLDRVVAVDRRYPEDFRLHPRLYGAIDVATLELDFGDRLADVAPGDGIVFHANGWIEYGYTRTTVAAAGEGFEYLVPRLETWDAAKGEWRTLVASLGYPAGFPRVMTYDLTGLVSRETPRLRIRTNFEVYWDKVWLGRKVEPAGTLRETVLPAERADLRWVGYPREFSPDGRIPRIYDYGTMDPSMPWKTVAGDYTRFGDVTPLLGAADDRYVIYGKGEEVEVRFDARRLPALPEGWTRSWILRSTGWCKGQELYTAHGWTVEPLPFLGMSAYPYPETERYPDDEAHREYRRTWNTRRVNAPAADGAGTR